MVVVLAQQLAHYFITIMPYFELDSLTQSSRSFNGRLFTSTNKLSATSGTKNSQQELRIFE